MIELNIQIGVGTLCKPKILYTSDRQHPLHCHGHYYLYSFRCLILFARVDPQRRGGERSEQPRSGGLALAKRSVAAPRSWLQVLRR
jgi:hypothetical protein